MADEYQLLVLRHAICLTKEIMDKIAKFESKGSGILPPENVLLSKLDMDNDSFAYYHGKRNMLPELSVALTYAKPEGRVKEAINELCGLTSNMSNHLVPLEPKTDMKNEVELYLVKEECLIKLKKMWDSREFINIIEKTNLSDLMEYMIHIIDCLRTMNIVLMEKEKLVPEEPDINSLNMLSDEKLALLSEEKVAENSSVSPTTTECDSDK